MTKNFYNTFHIKNKKIQESIITDKNYTYQSIILLSRKYFTKKDSRLADIGCGVGTVSFYLSDKVSKIDAYDISNDAISLAKMSAKKLKVHNLAFSTLNIESEKLSKKNYYDYIVCSEVIEHINDDVLVVRKVFDSLKKGGIAIFSVPSINAPLYRLGLLHKFDFQVGHIRRYSSKSLRKIFLSVGFTIEEEVVTEGLLRNLLFTKKPFGHFVRLLRWPVTIPVNLLDNSLRSLCGESNIYMVVRK